MIDGLLIGYDTASSSFWTPSDAEFFVCYGDRLYENENAAHARFPDLTRQNKYMDLTAGGALWKDPQSGTDIEPGNAGPQTAAGYAKGEHARGVPSPWEYADLSDMRECLTVLANAGLSVRVEAGPGRPIRVFTAHPTGHVHLCGPPCDLPVWADMTQFWWSSIQGQWHGFTGDLDVSCARPDAFGHSQPPKPPDPYAIFLTATSPFMPNKGNEKLTVEQCDGALHHADKYRNYLKGQVRDEIKQFRDRIFVISVYEPPYDPRHLVKRPKVDWGGDPKHARGARWQLLNDRLKKIDAIR